MGRTVTFKNLTSQKVVLKSRKSENIDLHALPAEKVLGTDHKVNVSLCFSAKKQISKYAGHWHVKKQIWGGQSINHSTLL